MTTVFHLTRSFLQRRQDVIALSCGLSLVLCMSGCGAAKKPWEIVHPAKGAVIYKGKPLAGAMITLIPQDTAIPSSVRPSAISNDDGSFELGTYGQKDGAPVGEYKAVVMHFPVVISKSNATSGPNDLPRIYAAAESTPLSVQIAAGETQIPQFEIK